MKKPVAMIGLALNVASVLHPLHTAAYYEYREQQEIREIELNIKGDIEPKLVETVHQVLSFLPEKFSETVEFMQLSSNHYDPRGMANSKKVLLNTADIESEEELAAVTVHEIAHAFDLGVLRGGSGRATKIMYGRTPVLTDDPSYELYRESWVTETERKSDATDADFVSGYAGWSPFEEFSESFTLYFFHHEHFKNLAKNNQKIARKYAFMRDKVFDGVTYADATDQLYPDDVFDVTLLSYNFQNFLEAMNNLPRPIDTPTVQVKVVTKTPNRRA